jgi:hypothetical protein
MRPQLQAAFRMMVGLLPDDIGSTTPVSITVLSVTPMRAGKLMRQKKSDFPSWALSPYRPFFDFCETTAAERTCTAVRISPGFSRTSPIGTRFYQFSLTGGRRYKGLDSQIG